MKTLEQDKHFFDPDRLKRHLFSKKGSQAASRLSASLDSAKTESALIGVINRSRSGEIKPLIKLLFKHDTLKKRPELMWHVIEKADAKARATLHRKVFPDLFSEGVEYQALYAALTITNDTERLCYLQELKTPLDKRELSEMARIRDRVMDLTAPEGFILVNPCIGCGKTSRISLVKKKGGGRLYVWKQPANDSTAILKEYRRLIERSLIWKRLGISGRPISWGPDRKSLLQPYVKGITLEHAFKNTRLLKDPAHELLSPLIDVFNRTVKNTVFINSLNSENLIFGKSGWEVIDSGSIAVMETPLIAWTKQRQKLGQKWARRGTAGRADIKTFLDRIEDGLDLRTRSPFRKTLVKVHLKINQKRKKI